ncbi:hypothetical protein Sango_1286800 [Sesamum angolense]|uniref:CCHC-type domain-containing protein n=1 Tax=Sesamum angolense TaxID=2727404 RepID=A0AAE1WRV9_9LAMI|nr:hypothetical protein Sango_1286800 [Sesamum angolense]
MEVALDKMGRSLILTEEEDLGLVLPTGVWHSESENRGFHLGLYFLDAKVGHALTKRVSDNENPAEVDLNWCDFHVRIHGLPIGKMTKEVANHIGEKIGRLRNADQQTEPESWGSFMRLRVALEVSKPLPRALKIRTVLGDEHLVSFTYERLPNFCYLCGRLGHISKWCDTRFQEGFVEPGEDTPFGPWLRAATGSVSRNRGSQLKNVNAHVQDCRPRFTSRPPIGSSSPDQRARGTAIFGEFQHLNQSAVSSSIPSESFTPSSKESTEILQTPLFIQKFPPPAH